ncbi:unnamed protein product [Owenia fusiformis]|uniref:Uncharacterized protein n=1 Tax=Owenia fusiformis TaxID=6347 RepID=A0A8J1TUI3_OWEFU|nr:unnamed protein product [Owenia fusiformis]
MAFSTSDWIPATSFRGAGLKAAGSRYHTDDDIHSNAGNYSNDISVRLTKSNNQERELRNSMLAYSQRMSEINRARGYNRFSRSAPELSSLHVKATHIPTQSTSLPKIHKRSKKRNRPKQFLKDESPNGGDTLATYGDIINSSDKLRKEGISSRELARLSKATASDLSDVKRLSYPKLIPNLTSSDNDQAKKIDHSDTEQPKSSFPSIKINDPSTDFNIKARIVAKLNAQRDKMEQVMGNGQQVNPPRRRRKKKIKVPPSSPLEAIPEYVSSDEEVAYLNEQDDLNSDLHVESDHSQNIHNTHRHNHSKSNTPISMKPMLDAIPEVDSSVRYTIQIVDEEDRISPPSSQVAQKKRRKLNDSKHKNVKFSKTIKYLK